MKTRTLSILIVLSLLPITGLLPLTGVANLSPNHEVTIVKPHQRYTLSTNAESVREILKSEGYKLNDFRKIFPSPESEVVDDLRIFLYPRKRKEDPRVTQVEPETQKVSTRALPAGRSLVIRGGRRGRKQADEVLTEPSPKVVMNGVAHHKKQDLRRVRDEKMLLFEATGYSPNAQSTAPFNDGFSAIGLPAGYGMVAVDPSIIPLGTHVYVEGYGYAIAADVGGDIQGRRIDLCFETTESAMNFGRKWVKVYILG